MSQMRCRYEKGNPFLQGVVNNPTGEFQARSFNPWFIHTDYLSEGYILLKVVKKHSIIFNEDVYLLRVQSYTDGSIKDVPTMPTVGKTISEDEEFQVHLKSKSIGVNFGPADIPQFYDIRRY